MEYRVLPLPFPLPVEVKLTIAQRGDYLFVASNETLIREIAAVESGDSPALKDSEEFLRLSRGMPTEGNSFSYMSERFNKAIRDFMGEIISAEEGDDGVPPELVSHLLNLDSVNGFGVGQNLSDGLYSVSTGNQRPEQIVLLPFVVGPAAVSASMILPALSRAKEKAESIKCVNNMKQIALGTYLYADEHDDLFPKEILETQEYLITPEVFVCPISPESSSINNLTWESLDIERISYEYLGLGAAESLSNVENPAQTVILRCKYHDHVAHADGSVIMNQDDF